MKAMIEANKLPGWSYHRVSNKTYYRLMLENLVDIKQPTPSGSALTLVANNK